MKRFAFFLVPSFVFVNHAVAQENQLSITKVVGANSVAVAWQDKYFFLDDEYRAIFPKYQLQASPDLSGAWTNIGPSLGYREGTSIQRYSYTRALAVSGKEFFRLQSTADLQNFESTLESAFTSPYFYVYDVARGTSFSTFVTTASASRTATKGRLAAVLASPYFGVYDGINGKYSERFVTTSTTLELSVSPLIAGAVVGSYFGIYDADQNRYVEKYMTSGATYSKVKAGLRTAAAVVEPYFGVYFRKDDGTYTYREVFVTSLDETDPEPKLEVQGSVAAALVDDYFAVYDSTRDKTYQTYISLTDVGTKGALKIIDGVAHLLIGTRDYYFNVSDAKFYYRTLTSITKPPVASAAAMARGARKADSEFALPDESEAGSPVAVETTESAVKVSE